MTRISTVVLACVSASCNPVTERTEISAADRSIGVKPMRGTPHGGEIGAIAVSEAGDLAITADAIGELKVWPTLDGTRQPVSIEAAPATSVALGEREDELVVAMIDRVGVVRVLKLGRDGRVHGRAQVPGEIAAREVVAVGGDLIVVRADETIERVDADGILRGRIAARPGERLGALSSRGGAVVVAIVTGGGHESKLVRWLDLGEDLAWGKDVALPQTIDAEVLALSPARTRLASAHDDGEREQIVIYALDGNEAKFFAMPSLFATSSTPIGFVSDDALAIGDASAVEWWSKTGDDYEVVEQPQPARFKGQRFEALAVDAFGDGVAVFPHGAGLALAAPDHKTKFLGWRELAVQNWQGFGDGFTYGADEGRFLWVDSQLEPVRGFDLKDIPGPVPYVAIAIGEHELAYEAQVDGKVEVELVDTREPNHSIMLGTFPYVPQITFEPSLHELAFAVAGKIERYRIETDPLRATAMTTLPFDGLAYNLHLVDPAQADGAVAMVFGSEGDAEASLHVFRDKGGRIRHERQLLYTSSFGVDLAGNLYGHDERGLFVRHGKKEVARFVIGMMPSTSVPNHRGSRMAFVNGRVVGLVDLQGNVQWKREMWGPYVAMFSGDDRSVIVRTQTGLVALDAGTGETIKRVCGWEFGLHESLAVATYGQPTVCEDDDT
jgi:hypothetical protein